MAALQAPSRNGPANPNSPVPLDTIPISPAKDSDSTGSGDEDATVKQRSSSKTSKTGDEQITVFHDPENFNVKHPLMNEWTLWFTKPPSGKVCSYCHVYILGTNFQRQGDNWNDLLKEVVTFDSVEEFWGVYVSWPLHLKLATNLNI